MDSPVAKEIYHDFIQLSPNESYLQITNVDGGLSLDGDYAVDIVDCSNNSLLEVTDNVFISEFTTLEGENQCKIEIINISEDFYRKTVYFRFTHTLSDLVLWSNPLNVTDYQIEETSFFEYKNYNDYFGIGYTNAQVSQSIRLKTYFDIPVDETELLDYFQINRSKTISARALEKQFEQYQIDYINNFSYLRINKLLRHDVIYLNGVRITNKAVLESSERESLSNFFITNFIVSKDYNDKKEYQNQLFEGINIVDFYPSGVYLSGTVLNNIKLTFDQNIQLGSVGTISIYEEILGLVSELDISLFEVTGNVLSLITPTAIPSDPDASYYVNITEGFVNFIGIDASAITDNSTWTYEFKQGEYDLTEYEQTQYLA